MRLMRITGAAVVAAVIQLAVWNPEPAYGQVYYYSAPVVTTTPGYLLPAPNYVVYSPNFMAWRSAGYYAGNWGPYYYNPPAMYPYISGTAISPNVIPAYPPVVPPFRR